MATGIFCAVLHLIVEGRSCVLSSCCFNTFQKSWESWVSSTKVGLKGWVVRTEEEKEVSGMPMIEDTLGMKKEAKDGEVQQVSESILQEDLICPQEKSKYVCKSCGVDFKTSRRRNWHDPLSCWHLQVLGIL